MIERGFVDQKLKEFQIEEFVSATLNKVGHSHTKMMRTPLGEKIVIHASRPGLVVGRSGSNIKALTRELKSKFGLENPQIEINEVESIYLDARIVAEMIASSLERFGSGRFKGVGHQMMTEVMNSGALGVEILISGKIPSSRAKRWRFYQGYLKKSGEVAESGVLESYQEAHLKTGVVGIQVRIMPKIKLPDEITMTAPVVEEVDAEEKADESSESKEPEPKKSKSKKSESKGSESQAESSKSDKTEASADESAEASEESPSESSEETASESKESVEDASDESSEESSTEGPAPEGEEKQDAEERKEGSEE